MFWLLCIGNAQKKGLYVIAPWLDGLICGCLYSIVMEGDSDRAQQEEYVQTGDRVWQIVRTTCGNRLKPGLTSMNFRIETWSAYRRKPS